MALPCNNLNLNLYRVFYTVAKTKSFSESSRELHISQPAISKHIQNLEYELDTLLFYRTNRGIELTPDAKDLLVYVEKAWNFIMLGEKQLQESKELLEGKISIGSQSYISNHFLKEYIKEFFQTYPNITIKITNKNRDKLFELFNQHTLDMLVIADHNDEPKEAKKLIIGKEKYCFAYNKEKMNIKNITTLEELSQNPLIIPVSDSVARKNIQKVFEDKGLIIKKKMELEDNETILNYVKEGTGIGYLLEKTIEGNPELQKIELEEELPSSIISLIYHENTLTSSSKEFIKLITNKK